MSRKSVSLKIASVALLALFAKPAYAVDLGLTPSHVSGLWTNANSCILQIAEKAGGSAALRSSVEAVPLKAVSGKRPPDVLKRVVSVRSKVDALRQKAGLKPVNVYGEADGKINPSIVFLNSGYVLDGLADYLARQGNADSRVTDCYQPMSLKGKTPSDAFALVDQALRRIDQVLSEI